MYSQIPNSGKLCNADPSKATVTGCSDSGYSSVELQGSISVCIHLSQRVRLKGGKKCTVSDCVCFTVKPMLCLGRLANVKLLYNRPEYLTLLWGGLTLLLHNCLHCITPQSWMNSIMNFNSSTTLWLFTYVIFKHNAWTVKRKEKSSLCNLNHKHKLLVAKAIPTKKWGTSWASIIAVC